MDSLESLASIDDIVARMGVIAALILAVWLVITVVRASIDRRRTRALAAPPFPPATQSSGESQEVVRILAFSSDDCAQCHRLQTPALAKVKALRGERIEVIDIDAPTSPELAERYAVLTLPTTVVLAPDGRAHAVNYGFADSERLVRQCDELVGFGGKSSHTSDGTDHVGARRDR
jgi:Asp-tRNA(Asn)/Glu-tRNA(Gln) amidotransferase A subunit family amidase